MANQLNWKDTTFAIGDTVRVHQTFEEGDKTRTQIFEGIVLAIRGHAGLKSFVVRKIATNNIGVEKIFPVETPTVTKVEVKKKGAVRRAKLYFLRGRVGKKATKVKGLFVKGVS
ncbi:50S ribosomal protein L19, partial [Candidatus Collierbacteria bacterium]|nr:50S ribosomal protein L19 [Candidatus Collierbacteria bacterium]